MKINVMVDGQLMAFDGDAAKVILERDAAIAKLQKDNATAIWLHPEWGQTTLPPSTWERIGKHSK